MTNKTPSFNVLGEPVTENEENKQDLSVPEELADIENLRPLWKQNFKVSSSILTNFHKIK